MQIYDSNKGSIDFYIPANSQEFISTDILCYVEFKVLKPDGENLPDAGEDTALAINGAHTLFKNVKLQLGDCIVTQSTNLYLYYAYIKDTYFTPQTMKPYLDATSKLYLPIV